MLAGAVSIKSPFKRSTQITLSNRSIIQCSLVIYFLTFYEHNFSISLYFLLSLVIHFNIYIWKSIVINFLNIFKPCDILFEYNLLFISLIYCF